MWSHIFRKHRRIDADVGWWSFSYLQYTCYLFDLILVMPFCRSGDGDAHQWPVRSGLHHHGEGREADALQTGQPLQTGGPVQLGSLRQLLHHGKRRCSSNATESKSSLCFTSDFCIFLVFSSQGRISKEQDHILIIPRGLSFAEASASNLVRLCYMFLRWQNRAVAKIKKRMLQLKCG